ncbi:hypothetical protein ROJ8625_02470 [Roseivivax jejudonensis]|uniref:Cytochrome C oxidase assembly protein n=1 Tax=Roseivivax jejudonensis TaxID=1529041 RepID=A0A1X6ZFS9_9RHOB|nr:hypothetical protein [Roseivivax jejudonensis]SLN50060.1 hypothetical protein ROJ8625_02470 [Roseivivax jejudonensis]
MSIRTTHEIHTRRFGRNLGLGLTLAGFIAVIFGLTVVKVQGLEYRQPAAGTVTVTDTEADS